MIQKCLTANKDAIKAFRGGCEGGKCHMGEGECDAQADSCCQDTIINE
jgi:hypothetical protein